MSEERYDPPPHERWNPPPIVRFAPGDLVVSSHSFYEPPRPPVEEHLSERLVYDPYCKLEGEAGRFMSDVPCLVLGVEFVPAANEDVLLLWAQDGTHCGVVGYAWTDLFRRADALVGRKDG